MNEFLSCDWGTSSFRLNLVTKVDFSIILSESSDKGILGTFNTWKETLGGQPETRLSFYLAIILENIDALEQQSGRSLAGIPVLISGMASSSIGMIPLPYQDLPFSIDGSGMLCQFLPKINDFKHDIFLISGARSLNDVMRGEETQLVGIIPETLSHTGDQLFIFPGTHSKHILVNNGSVTHFKTFMTGEFFDLLATKSILHAGIEKSGELETAMDIKYFEQAVKEGATTNLLNISFRVRTNALFDLLTPKQNYHYLSGLLIGAELGEILQNDTIRIYLCCGRHLKKYYETALEVLGMKDKVHTFPAEEVEKAALKGQYKIYEKQIKR